METLVDFGYRSLMSDRFSDYANNAVKKNDWDEYDFCIKACWRNADIAVKQARELGMTNKQIDDVCAALLPRSKFYNEQAAA